MIKNCNCTETNDFMAIIRKAYSENKIVWKIETGELVLGSEEQANLRLEKGKIECYFIPQKNNKGITFSVVNENLKFKKVVEIKQETTNLKEEIPTEKKTIKKKNQAVN